ncbi:MAG: type IV pilus modification protein PilV [Rhodanobacter sp.]|nr:MAG: type IV pilus modification protein PilV [Rhodanobacter sp.]
MTIKKANRGFTLIEVLIAMLVMSLGLLGVAATLITAMHSANSNYLKQQAVQSTYDMADRMRSNFLVASIPNAGNPYVTGPSAPGATAPTPDCTATACTGSAMAAYDVWQWKEALKNTLPGGLGSITVVPAATGNKALVTITVQWSDQPARATFNPTSAVTTATFSVVTQL